MIDATIIPLDFWQAPQGDVILVYSEHECSIYFACWKQRTPYDPTRYLRALETHASPLHRKLQNLTLSHCE